MNDCILFLWPLKRQVYCLKRYMYSTYNSLKFYPMENAYSEFETFPKPCYLLLHHHGNDVIIPANLCFGRVRTLILELRKFTV